MPSSPQSRAQFQLGPALPVVREYSGHQSIRQSRLLFKQCSYLQSQLSTIEDYHWLDRDDIMILILDSIIRQNKVGHVET